MRFERLAFCSVERACCVQRNGFFELFGLPMTLGGFRHEDFALFQPPAPGAPPQPGPTPAVMAIGLTPALLGRAGFGRTVGLVLVTVAITLLRIGFAVDSPPNDLEQVAIAGLLVGGAAGGVGLARAGAAATAARGSSA